MLNSEAIQLFAFKSMMFLKLSYKPFMYLGYGIKTTIFTHIVLYDIWPNFSLNTEIVFKLSQKNEISKKKTDCTTEMVSTTVLEI